ncbi:hypothetical protein K2Z84_01950 [Candidatus Binatia bacterium]|nr:hypothetical protein [Candidatus Binatia bacterium]
MTLAGTTTRRRPIGTTLLAIGALLLVLATAVTASAQCSVPNCTTCVQEPTCTQCRSGYTLASNTCIDVNECATSNGGCGVVAGTTCSNLPGSYSCNCPSGYGNAGGTATGTCTDVNECATANGGCFTGTTCTNTAGSRTCGACPAGYTGDGITCNDVNECATNAGGCAIGTATCSNTPGSRTCTCNSGYTGPGTVCTDVNECATSNGGCSASPLVTCTNTAGSRTCGACPSGYNGDGVTCGDINECATANGGCAPTGATCTNTAGSSSCTCDAGYNGNGFTCNDVNECATNNGGCSTSPPVACTNTAGSRTCGACPSGYAGNGVTCADVNECATGTACGPGTCSNGAGTFTCTCPQGVTGTTCDINGYVPPDKDVGKCESSVASNVAKYVKCVLKCRQQKADKALAGKDFDEQECRAGVKGCRAAYDKKVATLIAKGDCPACLDAVAQGLLGDDVLGSAIDVKGRAYCEGALPLAP